MPRTMDAVVKDVLGALQLQIAALQIEVERLTEENQKLQKDLNDMLKSPPKEQAPA